MSLSEPDPTPLRRWGRRKPVPVAGPTAPRRGWLGALAAAVAAALLPGVGARAWAGAGGTRVELAAGTGGGATAAPAEATITTAASGATSCQSWPDVADTVAASVSVGAEDVAVWVVDLADGCQYGVNPDTAMVAASTIKLLALVGVLELAQAEGRGLTAYEASLVEPMIEVSNNDAASELIDYLEATGEDFADLGARWGVPGARNPSWGLSLVSAREMANLVAAIFDGSRLDDRYQDLAQDYLDLPARDFAGGWRVAVGYDLPAGWYDGSKAGELYRADSGLNVHGVGLVEGPDGHRFAVAVLARGWEGYHASAFAYEELSTVGGIVSCLVASADPATCAA